MTDIAMSMAQEQIRELRAEVDRLQEERVRWRSDNEKLSADNDRLRAEVERLTRRIAQLGVLVEALADDLEAELNGRYPQNIRDYPSMDARYERDMANVYEARRALEQKP